MRTSLSVIRRKEATTGERSARSREEELAERRKKRGDGPLSREKWSVPCLTISPRLSARSIRVRELRSSSDRVSSFPGPTAALLAYSVNRSRFSRVNQIHVYACALIKSFRIFLFFFFSFFLQLFEEYVSISVETDYSIARARETANAIFQRNLLSFSRSEVS